MHDDEIATQRIGIIPEHFEKGIAPNNRAGTSHVIGEKTDQTAGHRHIKDKQ
jgi:hypothetical protein